MQRLDALLAPVAAHLVTAARRLDAAGHPFVDEHLTGLEARRDAVRAGEIARPNARGETVFGIVGDADRLVLVVERNHARDRPEDLLAGDAHVVAHPGVERRRYEPALAQRRILRQRAARRGDRALLARDLVIAVDLVVT